MYKGQKVFIRTLTHYYTGKVARITKSAVTLESAVWVADTGRFHNALKTGELTEIEPFVGPVEVTRDNIIDVTEWKHELPSKQK